MDPGSLDDFCFATRPFNGLLHRGMVKSLDKCSRVFENTIKIEH
jgi:hypothetical protein